MSPAGRHVWQLLEAARRELRRTGLLSALALAATVLPLTLLLAWALGAGELWAAPTVGPLALVVLASVATLGVLAAAVWWWVAAVDVGRVARAAERSKGLPPGTVLGVVELRGEAPAGTSPGLLRHAETQLAAGLGTTTPREVTGDVGRDFRRRRRLSVLGLGALTSLALVLGLATPDRSRAAWAPLLQPVASLAQPELPAMVVSPGDAEVPRGEALEVEVVAQGREHVRIGWQAEGEVPAGREISLVDGHGAGALPAAEADTRYWVEAPDGAVSDTFDVVPVDPLMASGLRVEVLPPSYLSRAAESYSGEIPALEIPAGSELRLSLSTTRPLAFAALSAAGEASDDGVQLTVDGASAATSWKPSASGLYEWSFQGRTGTATALPPPPLDITVVPDEAPSVRISQPGADTVFGPDMRLPLVLSADDDHGLHELHLVSRRVGASSVSSESGESSDSSGSDGSSGGEIRTLLPLEGSTDRTLLRTVLDGSGRDLGPGDALEYHVEATDNSPAGRVGRSATYRVSVPSLEERRDGLRERADSLVGGAEEASRSAAELERQTRELRRRLSSANGQRSGGGGSTAESAQSGGSGENSLDFQSAQEARDILEEQQEVVRQLEEMRDRTEDLERAAESAGFADREFQDRMRELRELIEEALTPELLERIAELERALDRLDGDEVERALAGLEREQRGLAERVERSMELLRRAAAENRMRSVAREARELATQQEALAETLRESGDRDRSTAQEELADRAAGLEDELAELEERLRELGENRAGEGAADAGENVRQAESAMREAGQGSQNPNEQSAGRAEEAAERLSDAAASLEAARAEMSEAWRQGVREAVDRGTRDALALAERESALLEQMQAGGSGESEHGESGNNPSPGAGGEDQSGGGERAGAGGSEAGSGDPQEQAQREQRESEGGRGQAGGDADGDASGQGGSGAQSGTGGQAGSLGGSAPPSPTDTRSHMRGEQAAVQRGLEALARNLSEAGQRSAHVGSEVGSALGEALRNVESATSALATQDNGTRLPVDETRASVDALNRLALSLIQTSERVENSRSATGLQEAMEELAEAADAQGEINGQAEGMSSMELSQDALSRQMQSLARQQRSVGARLEGMGDAGEAREQLLGDVGAMAAEAEEIARAMEQGRITPEVRARQDRLFHRLLDAGRSLEKEEYGEQRSAERPGAIEAAEIESLAPDLLRRGARFPVPTAEDLRDVSSAYRQLILEYFDRLNRHDGGGGS